ncbi:hypothetical protein GCM10010520_04260 [Rhizobium viscosum]
MIIMACRPTGCNVAREDEPEEAPQERGLSVCAHEIVGAAQDRPDRNVFDRQMFILVVTWKTWLSPGMSVTSIEPATATESSRSAIRQKYFRKPRTLLGNARENAKRYVRPAPRPIDTAVV